jgi:hypothetical protein
MRCDGRCGIRLFSVETKRMACDGFRTQTLDLSGEFQQYTQYTLNNSKVLTQSVHIPTRFGCSHYHYQGIRHVRYNNSVKTVCLVMHSQ